MKAVILAGGFGTRISEETGIRPKPMVEIGGKPIIWHIMKMYAAHNITDFVVLGGYKVDFIRDYFYNYVRSNSDFTIDLLTGDIVWQKAESEPWRVTILDTGINSMTGGRILKAREHIGEEAFCLTYGDGVSDVDITKLVDFHKNSGCACTVTAVVPEGRFGVLTFNEGRDRVTAFREKDKEDVGLINGGFFVCEPAVFDVIDDELTVWEQQPLNRLVEQGQLASFIHRGFWQSMDTLRDRNVLEQRWATGKAPWKIWD
ncbi:MAG: glucose-1-phosphate cytidylyltransferase [Hyphomonas sp.]|uniref:glucose-1-phosphate cytidylyltransferase n=1 Tax=Hyphomonas sp. TaxID=87 RepID=UPI003527FF6D